jgi:hypothetical protein
MYLCYHFKGEPFNDACDVGEADVKSDRISFRRYGTVDGLMNMLLPEETIFFKDCKHLSLDYKILAYEDLVIESPAKFSQDTDFVLLEAVSAIAKGLSRLLKDDPASLLLAEARAACQLRMMDIKKASR